MFSGIVSALEKSIKIKKKQGNMVVELPIPKGWKLKKGESINIDGVCSTIQGLNKNSFSIFYMPETLSKTTFKDLKNTHEFNLEKSLTLNDLLGGHLVSGHVDCVGEVLNIKEEVDTKVITFKLEQETFSKYIVYKGSISINGVSLTIVSVKKNKFSVSLIPYTLKNTNLGKLEINDKVNIEVDLMAKYVEKILRSYRS